MNFLKISRFPDFIQYFPDFSQRFPDFFTTFPRKCTFSKFFKVRKCERCGILNPRLNLKTLDTSFNTLKTLFFVKIWGYHSSKYWWIDQKSRHFQGKILTSIKINRGLQQRNIYHTKQNKTNLITNEDKHNIELLINPEAFKEILILCLNKDRSISKCKDNTIWT